MSDAKLRKLIHTETEQTAMLLTARMLTELLDTNIVWPIRLEFDICEVIRGLEHEAHRTCPSLAKDAE